MGTRLIRRFVLLLACVIGVATAAYLPAASGGGAATTPKVVGNVAVGKKLFVSKACAACHTLAAANATGTIGPNLDKLKVSYPNIVTQITIGGKSLMGKAAAKYTVVMKGYKGLLTTAQIQDIAAYVFANAGKPATTTTTATTTGKTTTTSGTTTPATTTTATTGGGATSTTADGCPPGQTIVSIAADDHDDDDSGAQSDGDGCV